MFEYPIFKHADFVQFISDLHQHIEAAIEPADHLLERVLPGVGSRLNNIHSEVTANFSRLHGSVDLLSSRVATADHLQAIVNHIGTLDVAAASEQQQQQQQQEQQQQQQKQKLFTAEAFTYAPYMHHSSIKSICDEWYGRNEFCNESNSLCFPGGIHELEKQYNTLWRRYFDGKTAKLFSRLKLIVAATEKRGSDEASNHTINYVINNLDADLSAKKISSVTKIEQYLRNN